MIGEEIEVRNAEGRIEVATVRYYRQGTGYKIQFAVIYIFLNQIYVFFRMDTLNGLAKQVS